MDRREERLMRAVVSSVSRGGLTTRNLMLVEDGPVAG
jgi:hypothetical protein